MLTARAACSTFADISSARIACSCFGRSLPLNPKKEDGTFRNLLDFRLVLNWFLPLPEREIRDVTQAPFNRPGGVDFEKLQELFDVLEEIIQWLNDGGTKDYEIMIDITGGQKVPGVAGAAVALGEGRRFQLRQHSGLSRALLRPHV